MADVFGDATETSLSPLALATGTGTHLATAAQSALQPVTAAAGGVTDSGVTATVVTPVALAEAEAGPVLTFGMVVRVNTFIHINVTSPISYPNVPAIPPDPELDEGNWSYPSPTYGGIIIRALYGKVVDMDTPVIVDGKPT
jgi:hypothetical protein